MKVIQILAVVLPLICLFKGALAAPQIQVSNVDCASEYLNCVDNASVNNPMIHPAQASRQCKSQVSQIDVCKGLPAYRSEDNIAL